MAGSVNLNSKIVLALEFCYTQNLIAYCRELSAYFSSVAVSLAVCGSFLFSFLLVLLGSPKATESPKVYLSDYFADSAIAGYNYSPDWKMVTS